MSFLKSIRDRFRIIKIARANQTRVFYINVGHVAPKDVEEYVNKMMIDIKKDDSVESFVVPIRSGKSRVEKIPLRGTRVHYVDVGNIPPEKVEEHLEKTRLVVERKRWIDYVIPVRGQDSYIQNI